MSPCSGKFYRSASPTPGLFNLDHFSPELTEDVMHYGPVRNRKKSITVMSSSGPYVIRLLFERNNKYCLGSRNIENDTSFWPSRERGTIGWYRGTGSPEGIGEEEFVLFWELYTDCVTFDDHDKSVVPIQSGDYMNYHAKI